MPQPATQKGDADMDDDVKQVTDQVANALQVIKLLSTRRQRDLGESSQQAIDLEGGASQAAFALKRLQPDDKKNR